jgi:hypothetical protein
MSARNIALLTVLVILLSACTAPAVGNNAPTATAFPPIRTVTPTSTTIPPTSTPMPPTATPVLPTETAVPPTDTPEPTFTPLPEGVLFRDDFNGPLLDGWSWDNENPNRWGFDDGWLVIIAEDPSLLISNMRSNFLWRDLPSGDFAIIVRLDAATTSDFQQAAIFIYEDENNFVTINRGYCSPCNQGGNGIYMDYMIGGAWGDYNVPVDQNVVYLKLESKNKQIAGYYALEADVWERLGVVGNYFEFKKVALAASNADNGSHDDDLLARFDYFEIIKP